MTCPRSRANRSACYGLGNGLVSRFLVQIERRVQRAHRQFQELLLDNHRNFDLRGRNHLDIDAHLGESGKHLAGDAGAAGRALRLVRSGVALGVAHTNFDVAKGGAADALAEALGLEQTSGFAALFGPDSVKLVTFVPADAADALLEALAAAGAGVIGNYTHCSFRAEGIGSFFASEASDPAVGRRGELNREPEVRLELVAPRAAEAEVLAALVAAHPYEEPAYDVFDRRGDARMLGRVGALAEGTTLGDLAARVEEVLGSAEPRVAGDPERPIRRAAVLPGGGADALEAAAARGAEVLVTGDVSHHRARAALDLGLALIDPGHAATERPGVERLMAWAASLGVECAGLLHLDPDPWRAPPG